MFKEIYIRFILASLILLSTGFSSATGQGADTLKVELKKRALERFENGDFKLALTDYRILMDKFPRDPLYKYYCGVCLVELNQDFEEAIEMLHFSSTRGVPSDVNYYLGEAYRKMYDFSKAKQYFIQYDKEASRSDAREKNSKLLIRSVQAATRITSEYNPFEVLNVTSMNLYDPNQYVQVRMKGGALQKKPKEFFSEGEDMQDLNSLMFLPEKVERGTYVYFAGYETNGKNGSQIFQAKKGNTGKWTDIKSVDILNTEQNEILPYYDPVGKDIYYASDGFEGIGGFDLYRSHYDEEQKEWSAPINLGFPINSAFDDYLLLPGSDLGMVMFFTGRNGNDSATTVYRVHFSEPKVSLVSESPKEIRRIANLGGVASETLSELQTYRVPDKKEIAVPKEHVEAPKMIKREIEKTGERGTESDYQLLIAEALKHQAVSDSLVELSTHARIKVRESDDPNDRWLYQKQILVWEKRAESEQEMADKLFTKLASAKPESTSKEKPAIIRKDTTVSNITVYRFVEKEVDSELNKNSLMEKTEPMAPAKNLESIKKEEVMSVSEGIPPVVMDSHFERFIMLPNSPYSEKNPIPVDNELPKGSFYRIQIGAFSKAISQDAFGGLSPITAETIPDRNLTKYYAGKFNRYDDAVNALSKVREAGFPQAYIVSWYNGSQMTLEKVRKLEK